MRVGIGKVFLYLIYAAAVIALGTFITLSATKSSTPAPVKAPVGSRSAGAAIGQAGSGTGASGKAKPSGTSTATLVNTGPGDWLTVFLVVSMVGTLAFSRYLASRADS